MAFDLEAYAHEIAAQQAAEAERQRLHEEAMFAQSAEVAARIKSFLEKYFPTLTAGQFGKTVKISSSAERYIEITSKDIDKYALDLHSDRPSEHMKSINIKSASVFDETPALSIVFEFIKTANP